MILTRRLLHAAMNNGSPNRHQRQMLGVPYPLPAGWLSGLVGKEMSDEDYQRLCDHRRILKNKNVPQEQPIYLDLQDVIRTAQCALSMQSDMRPMSDAEKQRYQEEFGMFDCVIGNYGIRKIRNRDLA